MSENTQERRKKGKKTRFPVSLFFIHFGFLLLMSGLHSGLIVLMGTLKWNDTVQSIVPIVYWASVAFGLTMYTRYRMKQTYDEPMQMLAEATARVAAGDFSIYLPAIHTADRYDYLDTMFLNFNKMVAELGSIETLKTDFFSNVSHEIKTPIAVIQNSAQLLQKGNLSEDEQRRCMDTIVHTTHKLSDLITNLLKLNKLEKQTIQAVPEEYDLCEQLCECALGFEAQWEKKNIEFIAEMEDSAVIRADASLMELVWNNLISNALKFTESGGTVILRQTSEKNQAIVEISDTGCGMNDETLRHMFDKFYQGDTSHSTEGNGLGLALVLRFLQINDCTVAADSKWGKGTKFTVTIPLRGELENE